MTVLRMKLRWFLGSLSNDLLSCVELEIYVEVNTACQQDANQTIFEELGA